MTNRSFTSYQIHHGSDARVRVIGDNDPILQVDTDPAGMLLSTSAHLGEPVAADHVRFARDLADATAVYADRLDASYGDPAEGEALWASLDTCPDHCGDHGEGAR